MPAKTMEDEAPKAFMEQARDTGPDYHFMLLTVGPNMLPDGTITGDMVDSRINNWLASGYKLLATQYVGNHKGPNTEFLGFQFAYHFVRE